MRKVKPQGRVLGDITDGRESAKFSSKVGSASQRKNTEKMSEKLGRDAGSGKHRAIGNREEKTFQLLPKRFHTSFLLNPTSEMKITPHSAVTSTPGNGTQHLVNSHKEDITELRQIPQKVVHALILMELRSRGSRSLVT